MLKNIGAVIGAILLTGFGLAILLLAPVIAFILTIIITIVIVAALIKDHWDTRGN